MVLIAMKNRPQISAVVPVYNEEGALAALHTELVAALSALGGTYEVIYVDDGSTDNSLAVAKSLPGASIIALRRNYGQAVAMDAGLKAAEGDYIVTLDADGQNDPADIEKLLTKLTDEDLDVVAGWRRNRRDNADIRIITKAARWLRRAFISDVVHDSGCTLRVYTREAAKSLDIGGEMHRYILALLQWKGFRIGEAEVNHRPRTTGKSKYGPTKAIRGLIDLVYIWFLYKYSQRPLHLFGYMSFASGALGAAAFCWSVYGKIALGLSVNRNGWFLLAFFFLLASIIFFSFGIVLDLLIRSRYDTSPHEKRYYVRSTHKA